MYKLYPQSINEPESNQSHKLTSAPIVDSDQPAHLHCLIRVVDRCSMGSQESQIFIRQKTMTLIRMCKCTLICIFAYQPYAGYQLQFFCFILVHHAVLMDQIYRHGGGSLPRLGRCLGLVDDSHCCCGYYWRNDICYSGC